MYSSTRGGMSFSPRAPVTTRVTALFWLRVRTRGTHSQARNLGFFLLFSGSLRPPPPTRRVSCAGQPFFLHCFSFFFSCPCSFFLLFFPPVFSCAFSSDFEARSLRGLHTDDPKTESALETIRPRRTNEPPSFHHVTPLSVHGREGA